MRFPLSLFVLVCLLLASPASAQVVGYGLRGGLNSSRVILELAGSGDGFDSRLGFQAAAFAELGAPLLPVSALVEVEYAQRGYESVITLTAPTGEEEGTRTASTTLHFLSVPVLARVLLPGTIMVTPYAVAGPRVDVLAGYDPGSLGCISLDCSEAADDTFPDVFPAVSFSGVVGAGIGLSGLIGPEVRAEIRYGYGFTDLNESDLLEMKNRGLDFGLVLAF